jgi:hypothetical protein
LDIEGDERNPARWCFFGMTRETTGGSSSHVPAAVMTAGDQSIMCFSALEHGTRRRSVSMHVHCSNFRVLNDPGIGGGHISETIENQASIDREL